MTAGTTPKQADLWRGTASVCEGRVGKQSLWAVPYREGDRLFAEELLADLFALVGRCSVPPRTVATVTVLQRLQGLSDREAVEAFSFDARWKYARGGLAFDDPSFSHTVLVDMRARLAASARPERIVAVTVEAGQAGRAGGVRRVLDSTASYDAVATMDTLTLLGAAVRACSRRPTKCWRPSGGQCLATSTATSRQPSRRSTGTTRRHERRWSTRAPRTRTRCSGSWRAARWRRRWPGCPVRRCGGRPGPEQAGDGSFRIARRVAADRVTPPSTRRPPWPQGQRAGLDGSKGHAWVDPTASWSPRPPPPRATPATRPPPRTAGRAGHPGRRRPAGARHGLGCPGWSASVSAHRRRRRRLGHRAAVGQPGGRRHRPSRQGPSRGRAQGHSTKDQFQLDLDRGTVTCPARRTAAIVYHADPRHRHHGQASFAPACASWLLRGRCTSAKAGRTVTITAYEHELAAAVNLARLGIVGLHWTGSDGWAAA